MHAPALSIIPDVAGSHVVAGWWLLKVFTVSGWISGVWNQQDLLTFKRKSFEADYIAMGNLGTCNGKV